MSYMVTELSPSPTDIKIRRLGSFLELRTPMLVVGEYQGGDRQLADGRIIKQAKIYYSPEVLEILAESALGKMVMWNIPNLNLMWFLYSEKQILLILMYYMGALLYIIKK